MLMLLLLFFSALLLASLSSFFGYVPSRSFRMSCSPRWSRGSLLLPGWFRGDVLCRMGRRRCDWSELVLLRVLLARTSVQSRPFPLHCRGLQAALSPSRQPGSSLGRRDGWRPEREADLSANSAWLDRPSAVLPIVALPRNRRTGHMRGERFFSNSCIRFITVPGSLSFPS